MADIEHVVLMMQENRSFDHYFGTMPGVRGFRDPAMPIQANGRSLLYQPDPTGPNGVDGYMLPFHLDTRHTSAQTIPSTGHAWDVQHASVNNGAMDNWLPAHRASDGDAVAPYVMGYYERLDIPFYWALAEAFTLLDGYHCSVLGPTFSNRLYWMTGMIDPEGLNGGPVLSGALPAEAAYSWSTYPERLSAAGVSWHVYQGEEDSAYNVLTGFDAYQSARPGSDLYEHAMTIGPTDQFAQDVANDCLPTVSWIIPTHTQSEHPAAMPAAGADYVASKIGALAANPEVWSKTVMIINYDENDGLFDHVAPPMPEPGTPLEFVDGLPIGGGVRVPCFVVSPWSQGGWVSSALHDHTSTLRLLEQVTGVREPNISPWRRETFGDFTELLGVERRRFPDLPRTYPLLRAAEREVTTLPPGATGTAQSPPALDTSRPEVSRERVGAARPSVPHATAMREASVRGLPRTQRTPGARRDDGSSERILPDMLVRAMAASAARTSTPAAYVTQMNTSGVLLIDTKSFTIRALTGTLVGPYGIAATPDQSRLYVTQADLDVVSILDVASGTFQSAAISVGFFPHGIVITPDGDLAYVANTGPDTGSAEEQTVSEIDLMAGRVRRTLTVGAAPRHLALSPDARTLYTTIHTGVVATPLTDGGRRAGQTVPNTQGLALTPDGDTLWTVDSVGDRILVLDSTDLRVRGQISVGRTPWRIVISPDGGTAYVTESNQDSVAVIDVESMRLTARLPVGHTPTGVALHDGTVWTCDLGSGTVTVIDPASEAPLAKVQIGLGTGPAEIAFV